ncbi:MAG: divergent polysaccharide deacetylase family protein [Candidatus Muiribacteriaceae bacterium]
MNRNLLYSTIAYILILSVVMFFGTSPQKNIISTETSDDYGEVISDDLESPEKDISEVILSEHIGKKPSHTEKEAENVPVISIVMDDLGYGYEKKFDIFKRLKGLRITMSVIPGTFNAIPSEQAAYDHGFEVMAHLPMQAKGFENSTEHEIRVDQGHEELFRSMDRMILGFSHIVGANNHMGSLATSDKKTMLNVLTYLKRKDLFFLDSLTTSDSVVEEVCEVLDLKYLSRDIFIDNLQDEEYIRRQIDKLFTISEKRGYAIGICHVRENTINVLENYLRERTQNGRFRLVFLSELARETRKYSLSSAGSISDSSENTL